MVGKVHAAGTRLIMSHPNFKEVQVWHAIRFKALNYGSLYAEFPSGISRLKTDSVRKWENETWCLLNIIPSSILELRPLSSSVVFPIKEVISPTFSGYAYE